LGFAVAVSALALAWADASAGALSAAELRGKQIYTHGTSPSGGTLTAFVGTASVELPARAVPCANCHGPDGLGRSEGGTTATDIRWSQLTKSYGHVHANGRQHPPFDDDSMKRLLITRLDPAGNRLDAAMPTYAMSKGDMADLIAYLKQLERDTDPGVEQDRVQVATLLPLQGAQRTLGEAMAQVLQAYFQEVNDRGGIYRRRIELLVVPYGGNEEETLANLRAALAREGIFALVGPYTVGLDEPLLDVIRDRGTPLVGAFTLDPGDEVVNGNAFYLYPGFAEQARALAVQALKEHPAQSPLLILGPEGAQTDRLVAAVQAEIRGRGRQPADVVRYPSAQMNVTTLTAHALAQSSQALLFLGSQAELEPLLSALAERQHVPRVYLLGALMARPLYDMPPAFDKRIFLAYPTVPSDISNKGRAEYQGLATRHALPRGHVQGQIAAYASARLLVEGLRGAGRELTRLRMIDALEALYAYDTGVTPRLTFGPNRRIGARGAHVLLVDIGARQYRPTGPWVEIK
jgi:ABC-type branched-subunit amino acid transport system substrate-binding protein